jgi:protein TonB
MSRKALVSPQRVVPIEIIEIAALEKETKEKAAPKRPAQNTEKILERKAVTKQANTPPTPATPAKQLKKEVPKITSPKPMFPASPEPPFPPATAGNGSDTTGTETLFGSEDVSVPGSGTLGGNGVPRPGSASGTPGLFGPIGVLKANKEAKPIQTVRASYPPMALRMGMEGDVTLRIEVDTEGKVTKAEIIKSGGMGFDDEALKAVKQSRFEPAQKEGKNVPAEFTYIYRFRLQK